MYLAVKWLTCYLPKEPAMSGRPLWHQKAGDKLGRPLRGDKNVEAEHEAFNPKVTFSHSLFSPNNPPWFSLGGIER
ncbi:hypothetical protein FKM82_008117 [Ascaphus truei]